MTSEDLESAVSQVTPDTAAHIVYCPGCENPSLLRDVCVKGAGMQCPRCGTKPRPGDIKVYNWVGGDDS